MTPTPLLPCPCGGEPRIGELDPGTFHVWCEGDCMMDGPLTVGESLAALAWNRMVLAEEMERLLDRWSGVHYATSAERIALEDETDDLLARLAPAPDQKEAEA